MTEDELANHAHHLIWVEDGMKIGKKIVCGPDSGPDHVNYRYCDNPKYLQNCLKKYFGGPTQVDIAIKCDQLRIILGVPVAPKTQVVLGDIPLEEPS